MTFSHYKTVISEISNFEMQNINNLNSLFSQENWKCVEINSVLADETHQNNFKSGIQSIYQLLNSLEHSIKKSNKYEKRLFKCKASHAHSHSQVSEWWDTDVSEEKNQSYKAIRRLQLKTAPEVSIGSENTSSEFTESWSAVSIICLRYQYEELSKRYDSLLREYNERCSAVNDCNKSISNLRQCLNSTREQLTQAYEDLLAVGDKYLSLRRKRNKQKGEYEDKIHALKKTLYNVLKTAEKARITFDSQIALCLAEERNSDAALLLCEIRKCNQLFLENLRLKTRIREYPAENGN